MCDGHKYAYENKQEKKIILSCFPTRILPSFLNKLINQICCSRNIYDSSNNWGVVKKNFFFAD